jgi:beta-N-acetylhexosaminidase
MQDSLDSQIGSLLSMGFEGTTVTPQVKSLIEDYRVGAVCLQARNLKSAPQAIELITSLQKVAYDAGYKEPLLISLDQENGGVNSIFDPDHFHQFPSAMGLAACRSRELTRSVSRAAAKELACIGVNWLVGPVFDVHSDTKPQPMGVRSFGEYPEIVAEQALESMLGYQEGGILTCIKHFPGFGNLDFLGSPADIPNVSGTFDQLLSTSLIPFQAAIDNGADSILVGACGMPDVTDSQVPYSCLSYAVVTGLLRRRMGFGGVILSDCLEIEALYEGVGVSQAAAMAISAGCDVIMLCQSHSNQIEAIRGIKAAIESGLLSKEHVEAAAGRVRKMKQRQLSWERAWNPGGLSALDIMKPAHKALSKSAYNASITLVRDLNHCIPLSKHSAPNDVLLLLTPLVEPFGHLPKDEKNPQHTSSPSTPSKQQVNIARHLNHRDKNYLEGEGTFQDLGVALAKRWRGKVVHTSYTASGISPLHERLVSEASAVVLLTADGVRNVYQYGFTKYIVSLCQNNNASSASSVASGSSDKPCIVVAVSSPYDFMSDRQVSAYICTYDLTAPPLETLVRILFGKLKPSGLPPTARQTVSRAAIQRQPWLVEKLQPERDTFALQDLFDQVRMAASNTFSDPEAQYPSYCFEASYYKDSYSPLFKSEHFVVRNSSIQKIYGFCATYYSESLSRGIIAAIVVSTSHRGKGIGFSLHQHALRHLEQRPGIEAVQFGSEIPVIFPGIPNRLSTHQLGLRSWVKNKYVVPSKPSPAFDRHPFYSSVYFVLSQPTC